MFLYRYIDWEKPDNVAVNQTLATLLLLASDPNIVDLYGFCPVTGEFASEFIAGGDVTRARHGANFEEQLLLATDLARATRALHRVGRLLCDWKPQQWMITASKRLKFIDADQTPRWPHHCHEFKYNHNAETWLLQELRQNAPPGFTWRPRAPKTVSEMEVFISANFAREPQHWFPLRDSRIDIWRQVPFLHKLLYAFGPPPAEVKADVDAVLSDCLHLTQPLTSEQIVDRLEAVLQKLKRSKST